MAFDAATLYPAPLEPRLKPWQLFVDSLIQPRQAMRNVAEHPGWRRWIWPLALLSLLGIASFLVQTPMRNRLTAALLQAQLTSMSGEMPPGMDAPAVAGTANQGMALIGTVTGLIGIPVGVFLGAVLVAAVLHFIGTVLGGQQSYGQVLSAAAWANAPLILREVLRLAASAAGSYDISPAGLSGLVAADPFLASKEPSSYLTPLLAQVEIWNLWYLALLIVVVMAVSRLSRAKALGAVALLLGLRILLGVAGVAIGNAVKGIGN